MTIDWSKAPEGARWHVKGAGLNWYKSVSGDLHYWHNERKKWEVSLYTSLDNLKADYPTLTPRPTEPKPYTRDEALQFLVERLDSWPTDIADAPLCPGWGWKRAAATIAFINWSDGTIWEPQWREARPDFVPFVSLEDAQPAPDMVNHPPHYQSDNGIECIDAIRAALGRDGFVSYCTGNAIKYLWRDKTDRVEDLRKAAWYLNRAIQEVSGDAQTDR